MNNDVMPAGTWNWLASLGYGRADVERITAQRRLRTPVSDAEPMSSGFSAFSGLEYDRRHTRAYQAIEVVERCELVENCVCYDEIRMRILPMLGRVEMQDLVRCPIGSAHNRTADRRLHLAKLAFVSIYYRHSDAEPMSKDDIVRRRWEGQFMHKFGKNYLSSITDGGIPTVLVGNPDQKIIISVVDD